jgi:protein phosphatase
MKGRSPNMLELLSQGIKLPLTSRIAIVVAIIALGGSLILTIFKRKQNKSEKTKTTPINAPVSSSPPQRGGIIIGNAQHIGARKEQQDSFGISNIDTIASTGLLAVLADGMGGLNNGAAYSKAAVQASLQSFREEGAEKDDEATLLRILKRAREAIENANLTDGGTTFIAALIHEQQLHFVSVGDSRICLIRNGGIIQLNREHVYGRELDDLAAKGVLSEEEATSDQQRAAITSYLGMSDELEVDRNINAIPLFSGDKVILMSDGVYGYLPETELADLLRREPMGAAEAIQTRILEKNNPHQDNLTIIVLEIE